MSALDQRVPALSRIAHSSKLSAQDLADVLHPVNDSSRSGKSAGMGIIIDGAVYIAQGSNPDSSWLALNPTVSSRPSGFGVYSGDDYTVESPLVIPAGTTVNLLNNAATTIEEYLPIDGQMYSDGRVQGNTLGSTMECRVTFFAQSSLANGGFTVSLDISAAGDGSITVASIPIRMLKGAGVYAQYSETFNLYALDTFIANGGQVRVYADNGDITVHSVSYFIKK